MCWYIVSLYVVGDLSVQGAQSRKGYIKDNVTVWSLVGDPFKATFLVYLL